MAKVNAMNDSIYLDDTIKKKMAALQTNYSRHITKNRQLKYAEIKQAFGDVSDKFIETALNMCNNDEQEVIRKISDEPDFFDIILDSTCSLEYKSNMRGKKRSREVRDSTQDESDSDDYSLYQTKHKDKKSKVGDRPSTRDPELPRLTLDECLSKLNDLGKKGRRSSRRSSNLCQSELEKLGWSKARIKAYLNKDKNPNSYYYRFNDPGFEQGRGEWTKEEKKIFFANVAKGVDYQWGLFSMNIPRRVGYQCSNYYRSLVLKGSIKDPNYYVDGNGKLKFKFKCRTNPESSSKSRRRNRSECEESDINQEMSDEEDNNISEDEYGGYNKNKINHKISKKYESQSDVDSDHLFDDESPRSTKQSNKKLSLIHKRNIEEQIIEDKDRRIHPKFDSLLDPLTCEPMECPTISPFGHVMDYDSWLKVLLKEPKNTCPFTKQKLTKRMLIKITPENASEYVNKIVTM